MLYVNVVVNHLSIILIILPARNYPKFVSIYRFHVDKNTLLENESFSVKYLQEHPSIHNWYISGSISV